MTRSIRLRVVRWKLHSPCLPYHILVRFYYFIYCCKEILSYLQTMLYSSNLHSRTYIFIACTEVKCANKLEVLVLIAQDISHSQDFQSKAGPNNLSALWQSLNLLRRPQNVQWFELSSKPSCIMNGNFSFENFINSLKTKRYVKKCSSRNLQIVPSKHRIIVLDNKTKEQAAFSIFSQVILQHEWYLLFWENWKKKENKREKNVLVGICEFVPIVRYKHRMWLSGGMYVCVALRNQ